MITCPYCRHKKTEVMPENLCQFFYDCESCKKLIKPLKGDCCVYCSYGSVPCPPVQQNMCCSIKTSDNKTVDNFDENLDLVNIMLDEFRTLGYSNIITKEEEFLTSSDKKGVKVFGSFNSNDTGDRLNYSTIFFATDKSTITIQFIFEEGDENLDEIVRRIENSIDFVNG